MITIVEKIPFLQYYASNCIAAIPETVRHMDEFRVDNAIYRNLKYGLTNLTLVKNFEQKFCIGTCYPPFTDLRVPQIQKSC